MNIAGIEQFFAARADTSLIFVSKAGDDANDGSSLNPLLTITAALAAVTTSRKAIMVTTGEYEEVASLVWPSIGGVKIVAIGEVTIRGTDGEDEVILINPTVQTATFEATLSGDISISAPDGVDGITFDNENVGRKINLYLKGNVQFENDTETDKAINCVHTDADEAMRIYCDGQRGIVEGVLAIAPKNVDDRFFFTGMQFDGGIAWGTATIASLSMFKNCIVKDGGGLGGQDTQIIAVLNCHSLTGTTFAIAALADFASNAAEVILPAA
jgi:hypothetical protein